MAKENSSFVIRLKKIVETRNYLLEGVKRNDLVSEKRKKFCKALNYFEHFLLLLH